MHGIITLVLLCISFGLGLWSLLSFTQVISPYRHDSAILASLRFIYTWAYPLSPQAIMVSKVRERRNLPHRVGKRQHNDNLHCKMERQYC
ncbi:hypothetical protein GGR58DRAFT_459748 [Xylaria digitata]|nr:hypothetical protein GGR58DRAFT_459748 [Xylaria digitata]